MAISAWLASAADHDGHCLADRFEHACTFVPRGRAGSDQICHVSKPEWQMPTSATHPGPRTAGAVRGRNHGSPAARHRARLVPRTDCRPRPRACLRKLGSWASHQPGERDPDTGRRCSAAGQTGRRHVHCCAKTPPTSVAHHGAACALLHSSCVDRGSISPGGSLKGRVRYFLAWPFVVSIGLPCREVKDKDGTSGDDDAGRAFATVNKPAVQAGFDQTGCAHVMTLQGRGAASLGCASSCTKAARRRDGSRLRRNRRRTRQR